MTIIEERLLALDTITLGKGSHPVGHGMCAMEAVAWVAGEPHSDHPECASRVVTAFLVNWNDALRSNEERDRLIKPLVPLVVGTRTTGEDDETRAWMATDWLVREQAPAWLRLAGLTEHAAALENLAVLAGREAAIRAQPVIVEARKASAVAATRDAAWDAAWDASAAAARAAAGAAARDAARDAATLAAGAGAAARDAARDAATLAAGAAAGAAAEKKLEPTVELLQQSAALLVMRMCEVGRVQAVSDAVG